MRESKQADEARERQKKVGIALVPVGTSLNLLAISLPHAHVPSVMFAALLVLGCGTLVIAIVLLTLARKLA